MPRKLIPCVCEHCGRSFLAFAYDVKRRGRHVCSRACQWASRRIAPEIRFWRYVQKTEGCWLWTGAGGGYGAFTRRHGHMVGAHVYSWELHFGPITDGLWVLHTCDVPSCVNPAHLWLGTHKDNMVDMAAKGRSVPPRRLTADQVREIRTRYAIGGIRRKDLAVEFAVSRSLVGQIINRKLWKNI